MVVFIIKVDLVKRWKQQEEDMVGSCDWPIDAQGYSSGGYGVERDVEIKFLKKGLVFFLLD